MSDNFDEFFNPNSNLTDEPVEAEQTEQHDATEVVETPEQQEPEAEVATEEAEAAADQTEEDEVEDEKASRHVPLPTFLDMRDRMKAAEKLAAEHQAQLEEYRKAQQASQSIPDPLVDPRGYAEYTNQTFRVELLNQKMQMSHAYALQRHDPTEVQAAIDWAKPLTETDPNFDSAVSNSADPIGWIIQQHKAVQKEQETAALLSSFNNDPVAAARKIAMEQGWIASETAPATAQAIPAATQPKAKVRPTSLKDIPTSTSKVTPQSELESFNSFFNPR